MRLQETTGDYRRLQETTGDYRRLQETTGDCRRLQETTGDYRRLQETTGDYRRLQETTGDYRRLRETTGDYGRLRETTGDYGRLQEIIGDYRRLQRLQLERRKATKQSNPGPSNERLTGISLILHEHLFKLFHNVCLWICLEFAFPVFLAIELQGITQVRRRLAGKRSLLNKYMQYADYTYVMTLEQQRHFYWRCYAAALVPFRVGKLRHRVCKSRARKRGWGQLGAGAPYTPC